MSWGSTAAARALARSERNRDGSSTAVRSAAADSAAIEGSCGSEHACAAARPQTNTATRAIFDIGGTSLHAALIGGAGNELRGARATFAVCAMLVVASVRSDESAQEP